MQQRNINMRIVLIIHQALCLTVAIICCPKKDSSKMVHIPAATPPKHLEELSHCKAMDVSDSTISFVATMITARAYQPATSW